MLFEDLASAPLAAPLACPVPARAPPARRRALLLPALLLLAIAGALRAAPPLEPAPAAQAADAGEGLPRVDLLIQGGRIIDGAGAPWYAGDIAVDDGVIVRVGRLSHLRARRVIDASGLVVAPGFIDMMGQTATPALADPSAFRNLLTQGITTINAGEGDADAPLGGQEAARRGWTGFAEYFQLLELRGLPVNVVQTVGHTQVRRLVLGDVDRRPDGAELARMKALVEEGMKAGAIGLSTALIYPPAIYADTQEISALAAVAGAHGGGYFTHMRNEGDHLLEAIDEALEIGRSARSPVHIFHLKAAGRRNWGKMELAIARIKAARHEGLDVTADIYPYVHNGLGIEAFIHPRRFAAGRQKLIESLEDAAVRAEIRSEMEAGEGWENWYRHAGGDWGKVVIGRTGHPAYRELTGRSLAEIAAARGEDPWDVFFALVRAGAFALPESMSEANKLRLLREEFTTFCTDVGPAGGSGIASHPRAYGAFPRLLSRYVLSLGTVSLERAIAQATAAAANQLFIHDRGRIAVGQAADLVLLDLAALADRATFADPQQASEGVRHVIVNGVLVLEDGKQTEALPGRVLRGPGFRPEPAGRAVSTGVADPRLAPIDRAIEAFLARYRTPGAAVAITDRGRLVYARGFGYADVGSREPVMPTSLFRIASVTKPITAVAILQLVEEGRLSLDAKVVDVLRLELPAGEGKAADPRLAEVTIRHLLQHTGGWDRDVSFDAMFQSVRFARAVGVPPPAGPRDVIRAMLEVPLDFTPGERYAYSNFGYCLLGRIIEELTGRSYEEAVQERVLRPLGIKTMAIGRTRLEQRRPGEVRYYDPHRGPSVFQEDLGELVPSPYGAWHLEAMDAHGAWIASAVDLARFVVALDDPERSKALKPASFSAVVERPGGRAGQDENGSPRSRYYGLGWSIEAREGGRYYAAHSGSLPGTSTRIVRGPDGRDVVILLNARVSPRGGRLDTILEAALEEAFREVREWPDVDLFATFP